MDDVMEYSLADLGRLIESAPPEPRSLARLGSRFPLHASETTGSAPADVPGDSVYRALNGGAQWLVDKVGPAIPPELRGKLRGAGEALNMVNPATLYRDYNDAMQRGRYGEAALNALGLIPGEALAAGIGKTIAAWPAFGKPLYDGGTLIFRKGATSPSNLKFDPEGLSFRDSLSNPFPKPTEGPVFPRGKDWFAIDSSRLPPGSMKWDNKPPGHVSVDLPESDLVDMIKNAFAGNGKLPK